MRSAGVSVVNMAKAPGDPEVVGRFAITRRLGAGAMGVVLVGHDDTLNRDVAVKLVRPGKRSASARARMLREAQAMARVAHPNVVTVYEAGLHGEDVYIAMELVDGVGLDEWLKAEPRSVRDILGRFAQAGHGLVAAHATGIVHRDFKPANVLVGKDGRTRVGDFGVARTSDTEEEKGIVGTPAYMAPEQLRGTATAESDQWSFGVALYRALHGTAPYEGESIVSLWEAITKGPSPIPPARADIPPRVTAAMLRALAVEPEERWPSMKELVAEIEAALAIDPDRDPARSRRQRRLIAASISGFGLVSGVVAAYRTGGGRTMGLEYVFVQSVLASVAIAVATFVFRRTVLRDAHGRRLVALFFCVVGTLTAHRAIALASDTPLLSVLRSDAVFVAALSTFASFVLERWLAWAAALMTIFLAISFASPTHAVPAFGACIISFLGLGVWFWREPQPPLLRRSGTTESGSRSRSR